MAWFKCWDKRRRSKLVVAPSIEKARQYGNDLGLVPPIDCREWTDKILAKAALITATAGDLIGELMEDHNITREAKEIFKESMRLLKTTSR